MKDIKLAGIGYMKCKTPGEDDFGMFVNENPANGNTGGFKWEILDYEPHDVKNYKKVYIYVKSQDYKGED